LNGNQTDREGCVVVCVRARQYKLPPAGVLYLPEGGQHRTDLEGRRRRKRKKKCVCNIKYFPPVPYSLSLSLSSIQNSEKYSFSPLFYEYIIIHSTPSSVFRGLGFFFSRIFKIPSHTHSVYTRPLKKRGKKIKKNKNQKNFFLSYFFGG
jgi:hypothetical protein